MGKAPNFAALIALLTEAERRLVSAGQKDVVQRLKTLRGVYYGTTWSLDYDVESKRSVPGALIRNAGFLTYLAGNMPDDPRPAFTGTSILADLKASQSMKDGPRNVDIGHLLIGLECRTTTARALPFPNQGGTGLEIVTWLGDLGGGTANLARRRAATPGLSVEYVFHNPSSDYGVSDNLEGDIAGYVTACTTGGDVPAFSGTIADAVKAYLFPAAKGAWKSRAETFATAIGATVGPAKTITNASTLVPTLAAKLSEFGVWYAGTRWVPTGELKGQAATDTCRHMDGAATEIATVFIAALSAAIAGAPAAVDARKPYPAASAPGACNSYLLRAASALQLPGLPDLGL